MNPNLFRLGPNGGLRHKGGDENSRKDIGNIRFFPYKTKTKTAPLVYKSSPILNPGVSCKMREASFWSSACASHLFHEFLTQQPKP
jgi:hypothetical protein